MNAASARIKKPTSHRSRPPSRRRSVTSAKAAVDSRHTIVQRRNILPEHHESKAKQERRGQEKPQVTKARRLRRSSQKVQYDKRCIRKDKRSLDGEGQLDKAVATSAAVRPTKRCPSAYVKKSDTMPASVESHATARPSQGACTEHVSVVSEKYPQRSGVGESDIGSFVRYVETNFGYVDKPPRAPTSSRVFFDRLAFADHEFV